MVLKVGNCIPFLILVIVFNSSLVVVQFSDECSTCKENEKLTDLIERFDLFQAEMTSQQSQQAEKIILLEKEISSLRSLIPTDSGTKKVGKVATKTNNKPSSKALSLPKSCQELRANGHFADGVYLVVNEDTNKIDALLCGFPGAKQVDETFIGTVGLKTQNVHFSVQRNTSLDSATSAACNGCVPFEATLLNIGGDNGPPIDLETGIFTAPVTGTYHFDFSAMGEDSLKFYFCKNDLAQIIAAPYVLTSGPVSFTVSLPLEKGDQMIFQMTTGRFSSGMDGHPGILYSGWLEEEELQLA